MKNPPGKTNENEPFVSVLTPVYNGEKYIGECIESVLGQNYDNWEYVIVNNQSTDETAEIIEEYAARDKRLRIHNNEQFLPVMENLNHAFRQISSESKYCKVLHADDMLFPDCISKMVLLAEEHPNVGIVSSYYVEGQLICPRRSPYPSRVIDGRQISRNYLFSKPNYLGAPTNLLIRSSLIRKRENVYDPSYLQSDMSACLNMLQESDLGFVHEVLTYTRRHDDCLTNTVAKKNFSFMFGDFKIGLDYGRIFLSSENYKKLIKKRENIFYILFARSMLVGKMKREYKRHVQELRTLNRQVKYGKLTIYLIRELILLAIQKMGIEVNRKNGQTM